MNCASNAKSHLQFSENIMALTVKPLSACLGAIVHGVDASEFHNTPSPQLIADIHKLWMEHLVLFFPGLDLDERKQVNFGKAFGALAATSQENTDFRVEELTSPEGFPEILVLDSSLKSFTPSNIWHTDVTFARNPPIGSLLSMRVHTARGGDTLFSSQYAAYETLSTPIQTLIHGLEAIHGRPPETGTSTHPVVKTHTVTGRPALFVNRDWTSEIVGLSPIESRHILEMLFEHAERPENTTRWSWSSGDVALWDNRCTMHYAIYAYGAARRRIHRVVIYEEASPCERSR